VRNLDLDPGIAGAPRGIGTSHLDRIDTPTSAPRALGAKLELQIVDDPVRTRLAIAAVVDGLIARDVGDPAYGGGSDLTARVHPFADGQTVESIELAQPGCYVSPALPEAPACLTRPGSTVESGQDWALSGRGVE
jgi:hypothetical protein